MKTIRDILADHPNGISRPGLIAWARLRIDPAMTEEQLEAELAALGDQVVEREGFLYLRGSTGAPTTASAESQRADWWARGSAGTTEPVAERPSTTAPTTEPGRPSWDAGASGRQPPGQGGTWAPIDSSTWAPGQTPTGTEGWAQPSSSGRFMRVVIAVIAVIFGIGTILIGVLGAAGDSSDGEPGTVVGADRMAVGDCFEIPTGDEFAEVRILECSQPHGGEVFLVADYEGDPGGYPTDSLFDSWAVANCGPAFADYTGSAWEDQDVLDWSWFSPTGSGWEQGDREMVCWLYQVDGADATRSYRGANP